MRIGIDVGGTFTDVFLEDSVTGRYWLAKTPSTPGDQSVGVVTGIEVACERAGIEPSSLGAILHGTTVATNAVLEGTGARVGLIVSEGWRHMLHLADSWTPGPLFGFFSYQPPEPLVDYEFVREAPGRLRSDGTELVPLDEDAVRAAVEALLARDVEAITVSLLNGYAHPVHEQRVGVIAAEVVAARGAAVPVSLSSEVSPEFREYERTVTTVMNSYLAPVMRRYLTSLEDKLRSNDVGAPLQVVRSDGGLMSVAAARQHPVQTALSGPSGGVNGAAFVAGRAGFDRIITFDMGGTSTDVAVCIGGRPTVTRDTRVGAFPVRAPAVDVSTIGAGGGSVADVSEVTGSLRVGPRSAGAVPGPACYGRGGTLATVTDANVVLGHLPPTLLGGEMALDEGAAQEAVATIARELGVDVHRAAQAIVDIVNGNMLGALRVATVQRGLNPRDFALVSFGGAGGLHANALAAALGSFPVVVPPEPGVLSALGFVAADVRNELVTPFACTLGEIEPAALAKVMDELAARAELWLEEEGVAPDRRSVLHVLDMRYKRQGYEITVDVEASEPSLLAPDAIAKLFHAEHERLYGFSLPAPIEIVNVRARAVGRTDRLTAAPGALGSSDASTAAVARLSSFVDDEPTEVVVYERSRLQPGMCVVGKAVVQQYDGTTLVLPGYVARVDLWSNLLIEEG